MVLKTKDGLREKERGGEETKTKREGERETKIETEIKTERTNK